MASRRGRPRVRLEPARALEPVDHLEDIFALGAGHAPRHDSRARQREKCKQSANAGRMGGEGRAWKAVSR